MANLDPILFKDKLDNNSSILYVLPTMVYVQETDEFQVPDRRTKIDVRR